MTPQFNVRYRRRLLGRLDLAIPEVKVAIEYDGRWHLAPHQAARDRERRARIVAEGWRFVVITAEQLARDYEAIVRAVSDAVRRI
ncbi:DUF559 domain-containing protein [Amycolatopsis antarctica]|uniref:DUF559 domain-containing protein n=1 Tax=Amycolatopsis antarctica TaxID=1854586 RepID=UPI001F0B368A|nr:DUF559 domain-containing protein [Amycolatopsis antarctica]